jgi:hypothetical protein
MEEFAFAMYPIGGEGVGLTTQQIQAFPSSQDLFYPLDFMTLYPLKKVKRNFRSTMKIFIICVYQNAQNNQRQLQNKHNKHNNNNLIHHYG